jgi:Fe2+ transport system protein B
MLVAEERTEMDVLDTLNALERSIRESPPIPFTQLRAVDGQRLDALLRATRAELERLQREPPSVPSRDEVLSQAANESKLIVEAARQEANELLSNDRIQSLSRLRYDEIVNEGKRQANQHIREAYAYTVERMTEIDRKLEKLNEQVESGGNLVQKTVKDAEKAQRHRNQEVARATAKERRRKLRQMLFG